MTTKQEIKARKSFNYQCRRASKCRKEEKITSCFSCDNVKDCEIQEKINRFFKK